MIIAATGHRPDKLGGYSHDVLDRLASVAVDYLQQNRPSGLITGMAQGWDTACALACMQLHIPYICAIPFLGQESKWPEQAQERYRLLVNAAFKSLLVCRGEYAVWKMHKRNEWMVDNCDRLVAMWDGSTGGTDSCLKYAVKKNKPFDNLWENFAIKGGV